MAARRTPSTGQRNGRAYGYDAENRLVAVTENDQPVKGFAHGADGELRLRTDGGTPARRYVTRDYHVDLTTNQPVVHYRFGGIGVAWASGTTFRHVLVDHLGSPHAEVVYGTAEGQRRYFPFGGDRALAGQPNLVAEERYTGQRRVDAGGGEPVRELYHYGARAYLPGVGLFTQPDTVVPDYKNPQSLNRYSYVLGNPLKLVDPSGHEPEDYPGQLDAAQYERRPPMSEQELEVLELVRPAGLAVRERSPLAEEYSRLEHAAIGLSGEDESRASQFTGASGAATAVGAIWTSTKNLTAVQNAYRHWKDHGADFPGLQNALQYVRRAREFLNLPPGSALSKSRPSGDVVVYDPPTEAFGVRRSDGTPRTYFVPNPAKHGHPTNRDYFNAQ